jgi:uncharacterized protein with GYD domain
MIEMVLTKYNEKGARGVLAEGLRARRTSIEKIVADFHGTLLGFWATDEGEFDTVTVMEFPDQIDASGVAVNLQGQASGTWERVRRFRLYTAEAADADLGVGSDFQWAGQPGAEQ